jgi:hypothetical protein
MIRLWTSEETLVIREVGMSFAIPKSLKTEHDYLHKDLKFATAKGGRTGDAARVVADCQSAPNRDP